MDLLPTIWFAVIGLLWTGYLVLEGFDLGVGMHMLISARTETERRVMLNAIGPVWDGNEVWLVTAGAATFAAFPYWYASLFSALYIPLTVVLLGLIFRAVAIEYRGKGSTDRWRAVWTLALGLGSFIAAFGVGAMLALTTTGLPLDANGDRVGGPFSWFSWQGVIGGLAVVGFALVHSSAFLALKTDGRVREAAAKRVVRWMPVALLPLVVWVLDVQLTHGNPLTWLIVVLAVVAVVWSWMNARRGREGRSFAGLVGFLVLGAASIFGAAYPVVIPSTLGSRFDLTVSNASSSPYTLGVMSWVALCALPIILGYQAWSYWVFRKRVGESHIPAVHEIRAAVRR
jgi:cytochrome d ubiquinol oxidase subunit II